MARSVVVFDPGAMPAHVAKLNEEGGNIVQAVQVNRLTYASKIWTVGIEGVRTPIMAVNDDGDELPRPTIPVIIVDYAARRGRSYFTGGYDPKATKAPDCWSDDGIAPDPKAPKTPVLDPEDPESPQAALCAQCPMSLKGSKVDERGKETVACQQHRRMVVALRGQPDLPLLQLQIAITSDYDATSTGLAEKGYHAFSQYTKFLKSRNINWTCSVVTRLRFDTTDGVTWPKVMFEAIGWTTEDEQNLYKPMVGSEETQLIMHPPFDGQPASLAAKAPFKDDADADAPVSLAPAKPKAKAAPAPAAAPVKPKPKAAPPPPVEEPEAEEAVDPDAEPGDEGVTEAEAGAEDIVEATEAEEGGEPETRAEQLAREAQEKAQAAQDKKNAAAKLQAQSRKNAAAVDGEAGGDDGDTLVLNPPKPAGKPAAVAAKAPATKAATPVAAAAKPAATKPAAAPAAAKPASSKVSSMLADWPAD